LGLALQWDWQTNGQLDRALSQLDLEVTVGKSHQELETFWVSLLGEDVLEEQQPERGIARSGGSSKTGRPDCVREVAGGWLPASSTPKFWKFDPHADVDVGAAGLVDPHVASGLMRY
jgi:hypothetical protein